MASSTTYHKVTYVFDKDILPEFSDAVLHSTIDVEWKPLPSPVSMMIAHDDVPIMLFVRVSPTGRLSQDQRNDLQDVFGCPIVEFTECNKSSWKKMGIPTNETRILTKSIKDIVKCITHIGILVENDLNTKNLEENGNVNSVRKCATRSFLLKIPCFKEDCVANIMEEFPSLTDLVRYYDKNPEAGRGKREAEDRVADILVNNRRIGEFDSCTLRSVLFDEDYISPRPLCVR